MENKNKIMSVLQEIKVTLKITKEKYLIAKELIEEFQEKYQSTDIFNQIKEDSDIVQLGKEIEELADEINFYD